MNTKYTNLLVKLLREKTKNDELQWTEITRKRVNNNTTFKAYQTKYNGKTIDVDKEGRFETIYIENMAMDINDGINGVWNLKKDIENSFIRTKDKKVELLVRNEVNELESRERNSRAKRQEIVFCMSWIIGLMFCGGLIYKFLFVPLVLALIFNIGWHLYEFSKCKTWFRDFL